MQELVCLSAMSVVQEVVAPCYLSCNAGWRDLTSATVFVLGSATILSITSKLWKPWSWHSTSRQKLLQMTAAVLYIVCRGWPAGFSVLVLHLMSS